MELSVAEWEAVGEEKSTLVCLYVLWDFFNYYFISKETQQQQQKVLNIQQ